MPATIKTLIITGMTDVHHDWRQTTPALKAALEETGRFEVRVTEEFRGATAGTLKPYDLVVLNYYGRHDPWRDVPEERFGQAAEQALFDFVAGGKGLIAYHPTLAGGVGWDPEYERLLGGVMREDTSRRAPNNDFLIHTAEAHPITEGWPSEFPHYNDDLYVGLKWPEGVRKTILLKGWDNPLRYTQVPAQWRSMPGMGDEHPVAWAVEYGAGRSVSIGIGHNVQAMSHPAFRALFPRSAEWAATGEVTVPTPEDLGQAVEGGDWWPTTLEPMVRKMFTEWVEAGEPATQK
ncbi:type 1 glutamine amidotransferase [Arthrobacter sp. 1088]|uniref:ThuA domain-containing protein n=1 Tax=Arthrobacter sp. 1088 TaxID=2817768 RepID=UPI00286639E6|nr:ThuA domain-containing protein [Arthrobacter sp. 1088]MDR6687752.1 type 1 glutamine amidotransferase [Arthrobacter sp. 1088]